MPLSCGYWVIENKVDYVADVTMGEDASLVRTYVAVQMMAAMVFCIIMDGIIHCFILAPLEPNP